ncbi:MAG: carboxylating nicotinate-nucleotide diphosphorylase [Bacteroidota bacterium]
MTTDQFIELALQEDVGAGDHSSLSTIPESATGKAKLLVKQNGIAAGLELAKQIFFKTDPALKIEMHGKDGQVIHPGDILFYIEGSSRSILTAERLVLNCMQRMSGIATITSQYVKELEGLSTKLLDTRKTTPLFRMMEKWAVKIGGGCNHRFGLYDMIMIKDNHVDYAGGITNAIRKANEYILKNSLSIQIEIETRNLDEVKLVLETGKVDRIMLDNFSPDLLREAILLIDKRFETEASGGITLETIRSYALTGVDYISCGALTHSAHNIDLSLKAIH